MLRTPATTTVSPAALPLTQVEHTTHTDSDFHPGDKQHARRGYNVWLSQVEYMSQTAT